MRADALAELRAENPIPELLPGLPLEVIRQQLDFEPPAPPVRNRRHRRAFQLGPITFSVAGFGIAVVALLVVYALSSGRLAAFSIAYAKAAIRQGEHALSASAKSVRYTQASWTWTFSGPERHTKHVVHRLWQTTGAWRVSSTIPSGPGRHGITDAAFLGGITEYYVPAQSTLYVNRPRHKVSVNGALPSDDPVELGLGAVLNVEPPHASAGASSFADAVRQLMAFPGARVTRRHGLVSVSVTRAGHSSRLVAHLGSYEPVLISQTRPAPPVTHAGHVTITVRFTAYNKPLAAATAAKALNLLRIYPHARIAILHHNTLNLP